MAHSGHMDHSSHMDHGDMGSGPMCNMNMLFTWETENLCIIFRSWRVTGTFSLLVSLLAVVALTAGYEAVRELARRYEARVAQREGGVALPRDEPSSLLPVGPPAKMEVARSSGRLGQAALYGLQVFYSFFIMLLFMTYNGWIMLAVGVGASVGYLLFSSTSAAKTVACH